MKTVITAKLKLHTTPEQFQALRTLLARQDWASTGQLSVAPDVSCAEIKAARLSRYAELRWSIDTSPSRSTGRGD